MKAAAAVALFLVAAGVGAYAYHRLAGDLAAERERRRAAEDRAFTAEGLLAAERVKGKGLEAEAGKVPGLEAQVEAAKHAVPRTRVVTVIQQVTKPAPALVPVAVGDQLRVKVVDAELEGPAGGQAVVGVAEVWRLPNDLVLRQPFDASLSTYRVEDKPAPGSGGWPWWAHEALGAAAGVVLMGLVRR